jgi:hypothetical protein
MRRDTSHCRTCEAAIASADVWLNLQGEVVCRRCYYADQTKLQAQRVEESEQELGLYGTYMLAKRMLVGGTLLLLGGAALFGAIRGGAWRAAGWPALIFGLGAAVVTATLRRARRPKD